MLKGEVYVLFYQTTYEMECHVIDVLTQVGDNATRGLIGGSEYARENYPYADDHMKTWNSSLMEHTNDIYPPADYKFHFSLLKIENTWYTYNLLSKIFQSQSQQINF